MSPATTAAPKDFPVLFFDFDDTMVTNKFSYQEWMMDLAGPGETVPTPVNLNDTTVWQKVVFGWLWDKGAKIDAVLHRAATVKPFTDGMLNLLERAKADLNTHIVVISDNCSTVVEHTIKSINAEHLIDHVITNPSTVNEDGLIVSKPFKAQTHCKLSFDNMCKGDVMWEYVAELEAKRGVKVTTVGYAGDGKNDLCPVLRLRETDVAFPRSGHRLASLVEEQIKLTGAVKSKVRNWSHGDQILEAWKEHVNALK